MYNHIADIIENSTAVHLSVDGWSSKMAVSFLGVVGHFVVDGYPVSALLHMMEVNAASKTAVVLQDVLFTVMANWKLDKPGFVTGISADSACKSCCFVAAFALFLLPPIVVNLFLFCCSGYQACLDLDGH
jgi:hypothetical protein